MDFTHLLHTYGYIAVFLTGIINLSTGLVLAGFASHQNYLNIFITMLVACISSFIFAEIYFLASRFGAAKFLMKHPDWSHHMDVFNERFNSSKGVLFASLLFRFIPGFRMMMPILLGPMKISFLYFSAINLMGSFVWAVCFTLMGYYFGAVAGRFIKDIKHYEAHLVVAIIIIGLLYWLGRHYYKKYKLRYVKK